MADQFNSHSPNLTSPASSAQAVVPSDTEDLSTFSRGLYVGGTGSITVEMIGTPDTPVTLHNAVPGALYPIRVRKVRATGTTATGIVALW